MERGIPGRERTRKALRDLIEGRLSNENAKSAVARLATRLIIEESPEAEVRDAPGRDYDGEHGAIPDRGQRNAVRADFPKTAEGFIDCAAPQVKAVSRRSARS